MDNCFYTWLGGFIVGGLFVWAIMLANECKYKRVLHALVNLKKYKTIHGKDEYYLDRQPRAWEQARKVLKHD